MASTAPLNTVVTGVLLVSPNFTPDLGDQSGGDGLETYRVSHNC